MDGLDGSDARNTDNNGAKVNRRCSERSGTLTYVYVWRIGFDGIGLSLRFRNFMLSKNYRF